MIDTFAEIYTKAYPDTEFRNPAYPSQAIVTVIGRICADTDEGKANEQSLVLETSRSLGLGSRVRLDVTELPGFSFFPGQIVVLSGINANGYTFAVTTLHEVRIQWESRKWRYCVVILLSISLASLEHRCPPCPWLQQALSSSMSFTIRN